MNLDWKTIRPLRGERSAGFEELCAQLASAAIPRGWSFTRKGVPDAGVECFASAPSGTEWCWQAKYFDSFDDAQISQIDESFARALDRHPKMVKYYICLPLDFADPRKADTMYAQDRWNKAHAKWILWAKKKNREVEIIRWGSFELFDQLARTPNRGLVRFWFDFETSFTPNWFSDRIGEAYSSAGPRYTPKLNVRLPVSDIFDGFGRQSSAYDRVRRSAKGLGKAIGELRNWGDASPSRIASAKARLFEAMEILRGCITALCPQASGKTGFESVIIACTEVVSRLDNVLEPLDEWHDSEIKKTDSSASDETDKIEEKFSARRSQIWSLRSQVGEIVATAADADRSAKAKLLIVKGGAGTGKTHLLCDLARRRMILGLPTILVMGQRFTTAQEPWGQIFEQLDLNNISVEEFVACLEASARVASCRLLFCLDALNEGCGRDIWPAHFAAFLLALSRSDWIATVVSVRTSYYSELISLEVEREAVLIEHDGFAGVEFDAVKEYFNFYKIEVPSAPLLSPEFRNPLFLKTLCMGLNEIGERRLPRGSYGISKVFKLFCRSINSRLALSIDYDPKTDLVARALEVIATRMVDNRSRLIEYGEAQSLLAPLLPQRDYSRSLYRGLVNEGILLEEPFQNGCVVSFGYERLGDHLVAKTLLDLNLDPLVPAEAFKTGGAFDWLHPETGRYEIGVLEALSIQLPERVPSRVELVSLMPGLKESWLSGSIFRQSVIWRSPEAIGEETLDLLMQLSQERGEQYACNELFLTTATIQGHPLNAEFLHARLSSLSMAERDAMWGIFLHESWQRYGAARRIVKWALDTTVESGNPSDVKLCATTLTWMLISSNRPLRDLATKALVNILIGNIEVLIEQLQQFANVNDQYLKERLFAVAYGVAMRSGDSERVCVLARTTFDLIFKTEKPPAHVLLRDYARGVIECAAALHGLCDIEIERIRPPYQSDWPEIPSMEILKSQLPEIDYKNFDPISRGFLRLKNSILNDDFARYVIGTNTGSTDFLMIGLDEPLWRGPGAKIDDLVAEFGKAQQSAWSQYEQARELVRQNRGFNLFNLFAVDATERVDSEEMQRKLLESEEQLLKAEVKLRELLDSDKVEQLFSLISESDAYRSSKKPEPFDLEIYQRYILKRVFDLGWTQELFGTFDGGISHEAGRSAHKAERIGKKYQWIAYHEISALVADHFQYCPNIYNEQSRSTIYKGPFVDYIRDIDPSNRWQQPPEADPVFDPHDDWWIPHYKVSDLNLVPREWVAKEELPDVKSFLCPIDKSGIEYLVLDTYVQWENRVPPEAERWDIERRELWTLVQSYFVKTSEAEKYLKWSKNADFMGRWMPEPSDDVHVMIGEHGWSPASRWSHSELRGREEWERPRNGCPVHLRLTSHHRLVEGATNDCSVTESFTLRMPDVFLMRDSSLRWDGSSTSYLSNEGNRVMFDTRMSAGRGALISNRNWIVDFCKKNDLTVVWYVLGERRVAGPGLLSSSYYAVRHFTGAYALINGDLLGSVRFMAVESRENE